VRDTSAVLQLETTTAIARLTRNTNWFAFPTGAISLAGLLLASSFYAYVARRSRASSERARVLVSDVIERAPVGLALLDDTSRITVLNTTFAQMIGQTPEALAGTTLETAAPDIASHVADRVNLALKGRRAHQSDVDMVEFETATKTRYFKAEVFPINLVSADGEEGRGAGIVLNDLTRQREWEIDLEEAKDAAEQANHAKSVFIANMSHELRTPLTAVLGYCELIEDDLQDIGNKTVLEDLHKINVNARHLLGLINDVLDLSKIEAQKMEVHPVTFKLGTLLLDVEAATGSLASKNNNVLELSADDSETVLTTDDLKVKQVLLNLIGNAAKFTSNGTITVRAEAAYVGTTAQTRFTVKDTGIGMTQEQLVNLFERFSQADRSTTRKYGGTGLGLALTRALAIMLGGTVTVDSVEGKGSTFTFTVPTHFAKTTAESTESATQSMGQVVEPQIADTKAPTVLVVDDDASARDVLRRYLTKEGFSVVLAADGKEGLETLKTLRPIAVLLDVMLPGMDGWRVLKCIRDNAETANIPVIMQTALADENFAYALGASGFLRKPVARKDLALTLKEVISAHPAHDVLIVDDDLSASARLKTMLERDGWDVRLAGSGADALKAIETQRPNLVLVDLIMPGMDGYAFVHEVRQNHDWDDLPLVVMTSTDIQSTKVRELAEKTDAIVQKGSMPLSKLVADLRRYAESAAAPSTLTTKKAEKV
jgi:PAS domain S-box-containing protein